MKKIRLDKYLVHVGYGSRSEVQKLIRGKKIMINEKVITKPEFSFDPEVTEVYVRGEKAFYREFYYFILHKPQGVISATEDPRQETVIDLLEGLDRNKEVAPVGRLDKDTEGLLILTNDGKTTHALLSPKKHVDKLYYAKVAGQIVEEDIKAFAEGITYKEGVSYLPGKLEIISSNEECSEIYVTIAEGKFHQVKRMVQAVGKEVTYLKRLKMGNLTLPEDLEVGAYRHMTEEEISLLKGES